MDIWQKVLIQRLKRERYIQKHVVKDKYGYGAQLNMLVFCYCHTYLDRGEADTYLLIPVLGDLNWRPLFLFKVR